MNNLVGIMFIILGLIPLIQYNIKEGGKTFFKIMVGASCGAMELGGIIMIILME